jgi:DNA-binding NarL/FixJ family response regulator
MAFRKEGEKCAVLLVDDHAIFRRELESLLATDEEVDVIGQVGDGAEAITFLSSSKPHVVVLDLNLPKMNGIELAGLIKTSWPDIAIIGLCIMQDLFTMEAFLRAGATAVISKTDKPESIHSAIKRACPPTP